jgi:hypothetical protein
MHEGIDLSGPMHLHFETRLPGRAVDPLPSLPRLRAAPGVTDDRATGATPSEQSQAAPKADVRSASRAVARCR